MFTRRPAGARLVPVLRKWQPPDSLPAPGQRVIDRGGVSGHRSTRIVASCECAGSRRGHRSQRGPAAVYVGPQIGPAVLAAPPGVGGLRDVQPERGRAAGTRRAVCGPSGAVSPGRCSFRARRAGAGGTDTGKVTLSVDCPSWGTDKGTLVAVAPALTPAPYKSVFPGVSLVPPELPAHHAPRRVPE